MISFQSYNVKSPLNGEAARWVADNLDQLPLDPVSMLVEEERGAQANPAPAVSPPRPPALRSSRPRLSSRSLARRLD